MEYREKPEVSRENKVRYAQQLDALLNKRQQQAAQIRSAYARNIFNDPERYRADLRKMLGWPLVDYKAEGLPEVTAQMLSREDGYTVYRMGVQILEDVTINGLFFRQDGSEPKPLVLVQHGGQGTPELVSNFYGTTNNYNDMLHRVRSQGVHTFAPQLLLWSDKYEVPFDRRALDARLKRVGSSIAAVEIFGLMRILDYFEAQDYVKSLGMVGLSYGGFYTLFTAALDTRIRSAVSCSFFNTRDRIGWSDWTWNRSAELFDDVQVACLVYPRRLCIELGNRDALFDCQSGVESFEKLRELCKEVGTDWLELLVFDGTHEFCREDAPLIRLAEDLKGRDYGA